MSAACLALPLVGGALLPAQVQQQESDAQSAPQSLERHRQAATAGASDGQIQLGDDHRFADGVAQDVIQADAWYRMAADQGLAEAWFKLSNLLYAAYG